jgi:hypothetical protein
MTIGMILYIIAAVILFLSGIGSLLVPNSITWALFCIALGLALDDYGFGGFVRRR